MSRSLHQTRLPFQLESTGQTLTSRSGLAIVYEAALATGVVCAIKSKLPAPGSNRGYRPDEYVMPLVLMLVGGGKALEEIREIAQDQGLRRLCGFERLPTPDAIGHWLRRSLVRAGLKKVNHDFARQVIAASQENDLTLDVDATYMATEKECAEYNYQGVKSFSVMTSFISDLDLCIRSDYRNGNVSPVTGVKQHLTAGIKLTQAAGKRLAYFRSDSAGYTAEVINCCQQQGITFTITADQDAAVKPIIKDQQRQGNWKRLYLKDEQGKLDYTGREYVTAIHCMAKTERAFTLIIQRWPNPKNDLFQAEPWCYHVIATNDYVRRTEEIIAFHNQRSAAENYHKELKSGYGMEYAPSRELLANATYFEIGVLAYNLMVVIKRRLFDRSWWRKTIATLRWELLNIAGKVVKCGRRLILKVMPAALELLQPLRAKLAASLVPI